MYCKIGEKPKVNYSFNNGKKKVFEAFKSPINVQIRENFQESFSGGQCEEWYGIVYNLVVKPSLDYPGSGVSGGIRRTHRGSGFRGPITFVTKRLTNRFSFSPSWEFVVGCTGGDDVYYNPNTGIGEIFIGYSLYYLDIIFLGLEWYDPQSVHTTPNDNCGDPKPVCEINVIHNGSTIFTDRGNCPVKFDVQCSDCPEGTIRCEKTGYPGYCCLPCQPIAQRINNLAARIK